jgi:hypothetical protein
MPHLLDGRRLEQSSQQIETLVIAMEMKVHVLVHG